MTDITLWLLLFTSQVCQAGIRQGQLRRSDGKTRINGKEVVPEV